MKKLLSIFLSLSMLLGIGMYSIADETEETSDYGNSDAYFSFIDEPEPGTREYYIYKWNMASSNYERYNFSTKAKAKIIGMKLEEFKFFARCVEAEGKTDGDDLTDKVMVACVILNRAHCKRFKENTVTQVLKATNQFAVVGADRDCHVARTKDSEWAIMLAYELVSRDLVPCHLTYFNSINYMHYKGDFGFWGNYFSCASCNCDYCYKHDPDYNRETLQKWTSHFYRPTDPNVIDDESSYDHSKGYTVNVQ